MLRYVCLLFLVVILNYCIYKFNKNKAINKIIFIATVPSMIAKLMIEMLFP